jgi:hypothetical protein
MTEQEWQDCDDPQLMLAFLSGTADDRKLRLFACACCRLVWRWIQSVVCREAVEISERYADGAATGKQLEAVARRARAAADDLTFQASVSRNLRKCAERDAACAAAEAARRRLNAAYVVTLVRSAVAFSPDRPQSLSSVLRDLFGPLPFRTAALDPSWLAGDGGAVAARARAIYDDRRFEDMPLLADALEEAGCTDAAILSHCRSGGPHVRGCWALDLLLGKQ